VAVRLVLVMVMNYEAECRATSNGMMYVRNFMKTCPVFQNAFMSDKDTMTCKKLRLISVGYFYLFYKGRHHYNVVTSVFVCPLSVSSDNFRSNWQISMKLGMNIISTL
jgi:hypothetical protein